jgi:hypothetical protein
MKTLSSSAAIILLALTADVAATPACMTKREARAAFPNAHLYWSGENRCWSDRRGQASSRRYRQATDEPVEPVKKPPPFPLPSDEHKFVEQQSPPAPPEYPDARLQKLAEQRAAEVETAQPIAPEVEPKPVRIFVPPPPPFLNPIVRWSMAIAICASFSVATWLLSRRYLSKTVIGA